MSLEMSRLMGKPTICKGENKDADQLRSYSAFVFATRIVQFLFYLNTIFHTSSSLLCLNRPVCVRPVRKPHCWFSHEAAQMFEKIITDSGTKSTYSGHIQTTCTTLMIKEKNENFVCILKLHIFFKRLNRKRINLW